MIHLTTWIMETFQCWVGRLQYNNGFEKQVDYFKNNNIISHQGPAMHAESLSTGNIKMNTIKILIKNIFFYLKLDSICLETYLI